MFVVVPTVAHESRFHADSCPRGELTPQRLPQAISGGERSRVLDPEPGNLFEALTSLGSKDEVVPEG